jgi:hypothetical protein
MRHSNWPIVTFALLVACGGDQDREVAAADSLSRELELGPVDTTPAMPLPDVRATAQTKARDQQSREGARAAPRARPPAVARTKRTRPPTAPKTPTDPPAAPVASAVLPDTSTRPDTTSPPAATLPADTSTADTSRSIRTSLEPASAPTSPMAEPAMAEAAAALAAGTEIRALLQDSITSLRNSEGQRVTALISDDLRSPDGRVLVPAGSRVRLSIARLRPARSRSAKDGELEPRADNLVIGGTGHAVQAEVRPVPHELRGRGVTAGEVEKVAAGAVVGAAAGGVITGKTKGAVIGGAVGAAGGAVVAAQTASRDVVVHPKTLVTLVLTAPWRGGRP